MYSYEYDVDLGVFSILDPDGDIIASVRHKGDAEALISHLNR